ncbi:excalibur calcium-binding domain-containing protein [Deinococcus saxicola]|uniref:excalibur calcium-binding domain-containing protein n=1 Tax=Deinococcus saxicola TaxID=249406 RepID=UPI0039EE9C56
MTVQVQPGCQFALSAEKGLGATPQTAPVRVTPPIPAVPPSSVTYKNCAAVRAVGKAPLLVGQPGYSRKLDRDGDGLACK